MIHHLGKESAIPIKRVLVVEDEPLIALEIADIVTRAGFQVLGPAGSVSEALIVLKRGQCDAAILDVNLGYETSSEVARTLRDRRTPYLILSSYSRDQHPAALGDVPKLSKPVVESSLVRELRRLVS